MKHIICAGDVPGLVGKFRVILDNKDESIRLNETVSINGSPVVSDQRFEFFVVKRIHQLVPVSMHCKHTQALKDAGFDGLNFMFASSVGMSHSIKSLDGIVEEWNTPGSDRFSRLLSAPEMDRLNEWLKKHQAS